MPETLEEKKCKWDYYSQRIVSLPNDETKRTDMRHDE